MAAPLLQPLRADAAAQLLLLCPHLMEPLPDPADQRTQPHEPIGLALRMQAADAELQFSGEVIKDQSHVDQVLSIGCD